RITCPMMAILGEQDQIIPNERSLALLEKWGGKSDYLIIENVGHNTISHTQEYWLAVNQFLLSTKKISN
ncbi:MAG: alpha/beta hydrolase, partial [Candidatus Marinimicrobia bacterium]|nr:alpha/beta hydrolase [Candidatus Neomarinimicrobiota bacterium]